MRELKDYILDLKSSIDMTQGEEPIPLPIDLELIDIANDLKAEAKEDLKGVGVTLATDDIILITYVHKAMTGYLFRNDSNDIMDESEDIIDRFIALLQFSGVPDEEVPDILENIQIDDKFNSILELKYKDDTPPMELSKYGKHLLKDLTSELYFIRPRKLMDSGLEKIFKLFDIEDLDSREILYVLSLFGIESYDDINRTLVDYEVDFDDLHITHGKVVKELEQLESIEVVTEKE